ncbi:MAG: hypothetical protein J5580_01125 [Clostridia bacterium]|nr:hypothetical protein [Clostridia bacterium]
MLGAFFLWREIGKRGGMGALSAAVLPVGAVMCVAVILRQVEIVLGVMFGVVAVHLAVLALLVISSRQRAVGADGIITGCWMLCGLVACLVAGQHGVMGRFGGLGLLCAGLVVIVQMFNRPKNLSHVALGMVRWWLVLLAVMGVVSGAWLMVRRTETISVLLNLSTGIFSQVVLAPWSGLCALLGIRYQGKWQVKEVCTGLIWGNAVLVTAGLGLTALCLGTVHIAQKLLSVTLPWVSALLVLAVVGIYLPAKTARWWGGLLLILLVGYGLSLLW